MIKNSKVILSLLGLAAGVSLVGSVSGSIAWYEYSIRNQVAYKGTTAHCSKLLQISCDRGQNWGTDLDVATIQANTNNGNTVQFAPITSGEMTKNDALPSRIRGETPFIFYGSPQYRRESYDSWNIAAANNYAQFTIDIKVTDIDEELKSLTNDIYLTDLTILDSSNSQHIADAIRVHFAVTSTVDGVETTNYYLFAKNDEEISVGGPLDLNNDGKPDAIFGYEWELDENPPVCIYGDDSGAKQTSYASTDTSIIATEDEDLNITGGTPIGQASETPLKIVVTIWLEGWCELLKLNTTEASSVWDVDQYVANQFNVGMTFGTKLHSLSE